MAMKPVPISEDYQASWERQDTATAIKEYESWHRLPEVLAPETRCLWYWQHLHPLIFYVRRRIWESRFIHNLYWNVGHRAPNRKWWVRWLKCDYWRHENCPRCGAYAGDLESDWYYFTDSGTSFNGDYTCHWFEGVWTCWRCLYQWDYGDSD